MQEVANIMGANDRQIWYGNLYKWVVKNPRNDKQIQPVKMEVET